MPPIIGLKSSGRVNHDSKDVIGEFWILDPDLQIVADDFNLGCRVRAWQPSQRVGKVLRINRRTFAAAVDVNNSG